MSVLKPTDVPKKSSSDTEWIEWHKLLKSTFGRKDANYIFIRAWGRRGGKSAAANTDTLRKHLKESGIDIDKDWVASISDTAGSVTDVFGDLFKIQKYIGIAIAVVVIGGVAFLVYNVGKNVVPLASSAAKLKGGI